MSIRAQFNEICNLPEAKDRLVRTQQLVNKLIAEYRDDDLINLVDNCLSEAPQISKDVLFHICSSLDQNGETFIDIANSILTKMNSQIVSFDDANYILRNKLFDRFVQEEQFRDAATVLGGLNLENTTKIYTPQQKAEIYVKVAEAFLQDDETVDAESFVTRASGLMNSVEDWSLKLRYRATYARVLDANRKFLEAAMKYHELSQTQSADIAQEDLFELLGKAMTCAILGKASPQRYRILSALYKDERIHNLEHFPQYSSHASILTKMYMEQILRKQEMKIFEETLMDHQKALTAEGLTIPERALIEHNMSAASKIYDNIRFEELGNILEISAAKAEKLAAKMIGEGRLKGYIDQVGRLIHFDDDNNVLQSWDERINFLCQSLNECTEQIIRTHPEKIFI